MSELYKGYRHPKALIGYAVRLYLRYCLSYRDIQEILLELGIDITYETIRTWVYKWGSIYAQHIRKRKRTFNDKWHIDEVYLKINGQFYYLWRLVDADGLEIEILLQKRRNAKAARRFLLKALKRVGVPTRVLIADKLKSTRSARRDVLPTSEFRAHKGLNELIKVLIRQSTDPQQRMGCRALHLDRHVREQRATALALNSHRVVSVEALWTRPVFFSKLLRGTSH